jgi:hypothetical protein
MVKTVRVPRMDKHAEGGIDAVVRATNRERTLWQELFNTVDRPLQFYRTSLIPGDE